MSKKNIVMNTSDWVIVVDLIGDAGVLQRYAYGPFDTRHEAVVAMEKADVYFSDLEVDLITESDDLDDYAITYVLHTSRLRSIDTMINDTSHFADFLGTTTDSVPTPAR